MPLAISVALTFPSALMASYYLLLQTYVLRLEAIMNGILLLFCGSELLLEALTLAAFSRSPLSNPPKLFLFSVHCAGVRPDTSGQVSALEQNQKTQ
ncbi:Transmembrane protein 216 [Myotis davidii]|uniref:Transmembrane protein 216 n=1 Tax=Myotis davidii TaxID=225400 RepID=L5LCP8_MYODS|nr:Transmembrane protein 216 [Myotis davidii]